ncbi:tail fiber protein [Pedobacter africanus]|uniref:Uncharacterized protein n=1 Tax=Pedobacter africanus TaxID=151894 RepID=A0A1W2BQV4_9SPHI|nr:tail fiber protein [Pedobacter africanus]SMC75309.1 hypothetical protein SAMN04488524_2567 [Pedobacter africanus]
MKDKILLLILMMPISLMAQILGSNPGDNVEVSSVSGSTTNTFMNKNWLLRIQSGNDWTTAKLHNGISVDDSFLVPGVNSKTWWERDPYRNIQSWGNNSDSYLTINQGKIGINTMNPTVGLQLGDLNANIGSKQILIPGVYNFERLMLGHLGNGNMALEMVNHSGIASSYGVRLMANIDAGAQGLMFQYATSKGDYNLLDYQTSFFMGISGNVGIGTVVPSDKLSVNGKIRAHEIKVETANWPDYVFAKDYQLPTLQETEKHIKDKGHLPGIPSAADVKANGVDLGEMNAKLLQKIEELTLHLIRLEKENKNQALLNQQYQNDIKMLKAKVIK